MFEDGHQVSEIDKTVYFSNPNITNMLKLLFFLTFRMVLHFV